MDDYLDPDRAEHEDDTQRLDALVRFLSAPIQCRMVDGYVPQYVAAAHDAAIVAALKAVERIATSS